MPAGVKSACRPRLPVGVDITKNWLYDRASGPKFYMQNVVEISNDRAGSNAISRGATEQQQQQHHEVRRRTYSRVQTAGTGGIGQVGRMTKTAQVILTGYDSKKIAESVRMIKDHSRQANITIVEEAERIEAGGKLWGCNESNVKQEVLFLAGTKDDLRRILDIKTTDGIYLQLLLK